MYKHFIIFPEWGGASAPSCPCLRAPMTVGADADDAAADAVTTQTDRELLTAQVASILTAVDGDDDDDRPDSRKPQCRRQR